MNPMPESLADLLELGQQLRNPNPDTPDLYARAAESLLRIRDREGNEVPLVPNHAQRCFEERMGRRNIVLKARQMGLTTWIAARFFLRTITAPGVLTVQVAQTREAAESIFRMVQRFYDCLPPKLQKELKRHRNNVGQMSFAALDSEFRILSAADRNAGRGLTIQNLHCSELSRWPGDAAATLAGMRAALVPSGELVLESTPNGAFGCFYDEWQQAPERDTVQHFFPWWLEPAYVGRPVEDPREDELALMRSEGLTPAQIGFRRTLESSYRNLRAQEFAEDAESCFRASGECCFEIAAIHDRLAEVPAPVERRRDGALEIWLSPQPGRKYLVAVDTAGGGADGDFCAIQVLDRETGMQCAELRQRLGTLELASVAAALAREYNTALIAVERNNHGAGVLAYLDATERYGYVFEQDGVAGWLTSAASKPAMISRLGALLVESPGLFRSRRLLQECRSFVTHPGGRMGAANGAHDDLVMAMAIGQAVRTSDLGKGGRRRSS